MNQALGVIESPQSQLTFLDKAANWLAWGVSISLFWRLGWMAMAPRDPLGAVSLLSRDDATLMLVQAMGLAAAASVVGALLAGRRIAGAGTFAAAIGLAAVSFRGGTMEKLLIEKGALPDRVPQLATLLSMEAAEWFGVIFVALVLSSLAARWCYGRSDVAADSVNRGGKHFVIVGVATLLAIPIFSAGWSNRAITHGQSCFVAAASVAAACYLAEKFAPVRSTLWSVLGVGLASVLGYVWLIVRPSPSGVMPWAPGSPFLRILPIQFVSVGAAAAVAMQWYAVSHSIGSDLDDAEFEGSGEHL